MPVKKQKKAATAAATNEDGTINPGLDSIFKSEADLNKAIHIYINKSATLPKMACCQAASQECGALHSKSQRLCNTSVLRSSRPAIGTNEGVFQHLARLSSS